ncbi:MAG: zinc-ribbon domain-containing protein [Clostridia bacterium]|nr:zinc-ribbon domain-containing protein [Clostridia bacterium]
MFCQKCGKEINDNAKFCTNCGAKVGNSFDIGDKIKNINLSNANITNATEKIKSLDKGKIIKIALGAVSFLTVFINLLLNKAKVISYDIFISEGSYSVYGALKKLKEYSETTTILTIGQAIIVIAVLLTLASMAFCIIKTVLKKKGSLGNWIPLTITIFLNDAVHIAIARFMYNETQDTIAGEAFSLTSSASGYIVFSIITIIILIFNILLYTSMPNKILSKNANQN